MTTCLKLCLCLEIKFINPQNTSKHHKTSASFFHCRRQMLNLIWVRWLPRDLWERFTESETGSINKPNQKSYEPRRYRVCMIYGWWWLMMVDDGWWWLIMGCHQPYTDHMNHMSLPIFFHPRDGPSQHICDKSGSSWRAGTPTSQAAARTPAVEKIPPVLSNMACRKPWTIEVGDFPS